MGEEDGGVGVGRRKEEIEGEKASENLRVFACFCSEGRLLIMLSITMTFTVHTVRVVRVFRC